MFLSFVQLRVTISAPNKVVFEIDNLFFCFNMRSQILRETIVKIIKLQAMQDAPPLQLYPASDKFLM